MRRRLAVTFAKGTLILIVSGALLGALGPRGARAAGAEPDLGLQLRKAEAAVVAAPHDPTAWFDLGRAALANGKAGLATAAFRRALRLRPAWGPPLVGVGEVFEAEGDPRDAFVWYYRAVLLDRGYAPAWIDAIRLARRLGDRPAVTALAHQGLAAFPATGPLRRYFERALEGKR